MKMSENLPLLPDPADHFASPVEGQEAEATGKTFFTDKELFIRQAFHEHPGKGLELLFREYYAPLCSHAIRFVYSREIARDLVSDLFCAFYQKELYKRIDSSYRTYLYRCVRNDALKYLERDAGRSSGMVTEEDMPEAASSPEDIFRFEELSGRIETAIQSLPPQPQKVFLMSRYDGKKYQEISTELQISLKTVEAHMSKALQTLRKALQKDWLIGLLWAWLN